MTEYVLVCCRSFAYSTEDVLLILKDRPDWQKGRLNLPGGKIEEGETPEQAAVRELKEEAGLYPIFPVKLMGSMKDRDFTIHCLEAWVNYHAEIIPQEGETEVVSWHKWPEVSRDPRILPNLNVIIPLIKAGVTDWIITDTYTSAGKERHSFSISIKQGGSK